MTIFSPCFTFSRLLITQHYRSNPPTFSLSIFPIFSFIFHIASYSFSLIPYSLFPSFHNNNNQNKTNPKPCDTYFCGMVLFHLNIVISNLSISLQVTELNYILYMDNIFLIHFPLYVYLAPFHISSIVNSAAISMGIQASPLYASFSFSQPL